MDWILIKSVRVRTMGLVLIGVLPALALMVYSASEQRQLDALHARAEAQRQAILTAADQAEQVVGARQLLQLLARLPVMRAGDAGACNELLGRLLPRYPSFSNITVMTPGGDVTCSAPSAPPNLNLADRAYFQRAVATHGFAAGDYILGRISGKPTIDFAHPVVGSDGRISQVLALGIDLTWLNQSMGAGRWPAGTTLTLVDPAGTIVASYPDAARIGKPLRGSMAIDTAWLGREGTARASQGVAPMLVGYATAEGGTRAAALHVLVGIPEAVAFAAADRQLVRNLLLMSAAFVLASIAAWALGSRLIVRPVRSLSRVARELSAGEFSVRAGPPYGSGELGVLAEAFDRMATNLKDAYLNTIRVLAAAIGARDPGGLGHVSRAAKYAVAFGRALKWDEAQLTRLQLGATLHDVGKIGCPDAVLRKEGSLDPEERSLVRTHPAAGARLLQRVPFLHPALDSVRYHHERYDGSGYPEGLSGTAIPLEARVVAIIDAFDAMTAPKPYGQGRPVAEAVAEIERSAGSQFDPALAGEFTRAVQAGAITLETGVTHSVEIRA